MELNNKWWRLNNLYSVKGEGKGKPVKFRLRPEQKLVLEHLHSNPGVPLYIIKARRLGLSTGIAVDMGDEQKFSAGSSGLIIERNAAEAAHKMKNMVQFAHTSMPQELQDTFAIIRKNDSAFELCVKAPDVVSSTIRAGTSGRGSDLSYLHVSEGQVIASDGLDGEKRFSEIISGGWEAARLGKRVIETTWMGGKGGQLWKIIEPIMQKSLGVKGKIMFFPWHNDPVCHDMDGGQVPGEIEEYFRKLGDQLGKTFSQEQKRWYTLTKATQGIYMNREYPSTLAEAFSAPVEGAIYAGELDKALTEGRINPMPVSGESLVFTTWDLGSPSNTKVCYWQKVAREIRMIDCDDGGPIDWTYTQRVAHMLAKGYSYAAHYLPHDGGTRDKGGQSMQQQLIAHGLNNVRVIPRTPDVWLGINAVLELFPTLAFRDPQTTACVEALKAYRVKAGDTQPLHDWASHFADSVRTLGEAYLEGELAVDFAPRHAKEMRQRDLQGLPRRKMQLREAG